MELSREHFRAISFYNFRRGLSRQECIDELKSSNVKNWFRRPLLDEVREGRPKTAVASENIDAVR